MRLQVLGCGNAFGSCGRFHTCFRGKAAQTAFLIDCGTSSLIVIRRFGFAVREIEAEMPVEVGGVSMTAYAECGIPPARLARAAPGLRRQGAGLYRRYRVGRRADSCRPQGTS